MPKCCFCPRKSEYGVLRTQQIINKCQRDAAFRSLLDQHDSFCKKHIFCYFVKQNGVFGPVWPMKAFWLASGCRKWPCCVIGFWKRPCFDTCVITGRRGQLYIFSRAEETWIKRIKLSEHVHMWSSCQIGQVRNERSQVICQPEGYGCM